MSRVGGGVGWGGGEGMVEEKEQLLIPYHIHGFTSI